MENIPAEAPLAADEVKRVIEGRGAARRVPNGIQMWFFPKWFDEPYREIARRYPCDIEKVHLWTPRVFDAPADAPNYRWMDRDDPFPPGTAMDAVCALEDLDELDAVIADFPDPYYPGMIPPNIPPKGERYRLGRWWYCLFETYWSMRGMENALCDFYEEPERVHQFFRALTDFFKVVITRMKGLGCDGVLTTDDIGTQMAPFFSLEIFREFFKPYYKEMIDHAHSLGMHFWLHSCGNIELFIPDFIEIGLDVLHPIQKYTMEERQIAEKYGDKLCIWAGFDVQRTIPYGTPEEVRAEVRHMMDTYYRPEGRLIMAAGNALTPDTPLASLEALLDETICYGAIVGKNK